MWVWPLAAACCYLPPPLAAAVRDAASLVVAWMRVL